MKQFDLYKTTLTDRNDISEELHNWLAKSPFTQANHPNRHVDACIILRSIYEDGAVSPVICWVNEDVSGFFFNPGKMRMQTWKAFPDKLKIPVYIIDPYRTKKSTALVKENFVNAHRTSDHVDFTLRPHKDHHRLFPLINSLTNKEIDTNYFYGDGKYSSMRHEYELAYQMQDKRLEIYCEGELIYKLGEQEEVLKVTVDKPWKAWYPFVEYMGVFDDVFYSN